MNSEEVIRFDILKKLRDFLPTLPDSKLWLTAFSCGPMGPVGPDNYEEALACQETTFDLIGLIPAVASEYAHRFVFYEPHFGEVYNYPKISSDLIPDKDIRAFINSPFWVNDISQAISRLDYVLKHRSAPEEWDYTWWKG